MPIIAITREMGSLGKDVAAGLAEELGLPLVYHEVIDQLADRMRVRKSHVIRLLDGSAGLLEQLTADKTSLSVYTAEEILAVAARGKGAVIRGWGATHLLRSVPHAVCVRVCAPFELRKARMLQRLGTDDADKVAMEIRDNDEAHAAIIRRHFNFNFADAEHYDLVLNTERMSAAECVEQVLRAVRSPDFAETAASQQALADLALSWQVKAALRHSRRTRGMRVTVRAEGATVHFNGAGYSAEERAAMREVVQAVPGVREINDGMRDLEVRARFA
jgi:cytidylate kinase